MKRHWMGGSKSQVHSSRSSKESVQREFFSELKRRLREPSHESPLQEELELCQNATSLIQMVQILPSKDLMILASPTPSSSLPNRIHTSPTSQTTQTHVSTIQIPARTDDSSPAARRIDSTSLHELSSSVSPSISSHSSQSPIHFSLHQTQMQQTSMNGSSTPMQPAPRYAFQHHIVSPLERPSVPPPASSHYIAPNHWMNSASYNSTTPEEEDQ